MCNVKLFQFGLSALWKTPERSELELSFLTAAHSQIERYEFLGNTSDPAGGRKPGKVVRVSGQNYSNHSKSCPQWNSFWCTVYTSTLCIANPPQPQQQQQQPKSFKYTIQVIGFVLAGTGSDVMPAMQVRFVHGVRNKEEYGCVEAMCSGAQLYVLCLWPIRNNCIR